MHYWSCIVNITLFTVSCDWSVLLFFFLVCFCVYFELTCTRATIHTRSHHALLTGFQVQLSYGGRNLQPKIKMPQSKTTSVNYCIFFFLNKCFCNVTHIFIWFKISLPKWICLVSATFSMWWLLWNSGWQRLRVAKRKEVIISLM